jgi:hypothetical protein
MKSLIVAAVAVFGLGGCIAVPAPYGPEAYYYPAPAVVGVYGFGPHHGHGRHHHRRHRGWH